MSDAPTPASAGMSEVEALRRRVAELENGLHAIEDGFAAFDAGWRVRYLNPAAERILGRPAGELIGTVFWEEFPALVGTETEAAARRAMAGRVPSRAVGHFAARYFPSADGGVAALFRERGGESETEQALRLSEERLRLAEEAARFGVWSLDLFDPAKNYCSPEAHAIAGFDPAWRPDYTDWLARVHPEDRARVDETISRAFADGRDEIQIAYRLRRPDGTERRLEARGRVRRNAAGTALGAHGVTLDTTERMRAEQALRESELFNRSIIESSRDCIKVLSLDGRLLSMNSRGQEILGIGDICQRLNTSWFDFWQGGDRDRCLAAVEAARAGDTGSFEGEFTTQDGGRLWFHVVVSPIRDAAGNVRQLLAISRDMTESRRAEQAIRESERQWRAVANAMPQFVWIAHSPGEIEFLNRYWFDYTGAPPDQPAEESWGAVHPDDVLALRDMWERALATGLEQTCEYRVRRGSDGAYRWHVGFHRPLRNDRGEIERWVGIGIEIHDRKAAEEAARASEERQRLAVKAGAVGLWDWDITANHVDWTERVYEFHGVPPGRFGGSVEDFARFVHPEDAERVSLAIRRAVEDGAEYNLDFRVVRPDGATRWLTTSATVIRDAQGRPLRMLGATLDVTERKRVEQELRSTKEALQALIEHAPDGLFVADPSGRALDVNPALCAILGYPREELLRKSIADLVRPDDHGRLGKAKANILAGKAEIGEWQLAHRSGAWIPVEISAKLLPDGRWQGFVRDIRERKRLEARVRHLAAIVESSEDAILSLDLNGAVTSWNRGAERLYGYAAEEVIGRPVAMLAAPGRADETPAILERIRGGEQISHFETVRMAKDGRRIEVSLTVSPVRDESGHVTGASKIARDVTEKKRAEEALSRSREQLRFVFENAPAFIAYIDPDYRYVRVNKAYEDWFGLPAKEIRGKHIRDAFGEEYFVSVRDRLERARAGAKVDFDAAALRPNGERHDLAVIYTPDRDRHGAVQGFIALLQDVTERKRSETALREREEELRRLLAAIPDVICRFDRGGRFLYANPAIERLTGVPAAGFVGRTLGASGLGPDLAAALSGGISEAFGGAGPVPMECGFLSPTRGLRHLFAIAVPERSDPGGVTSVLYIIRDITERKQAEQERAILLGREKEARETAERLNRIGPILAAELDPGRLVQSVTDIATELTGAEFGSFFHNVVDEKGESYMLYTLSGASKESFAGFSMPRNTDVFGPTFRGEGVVRSDDIKRDPRYGRNWPNKGMPEGHLPVASYLAVPVQSRSGEVLGGLFFGHPAPGRFTEAHEALITGLAAQAAIAMDNARLFEQAQRARGELERSNRELRRANQDLETFAYSASHDLQEPLRMIAISAQLLDRRAGSLSPDSRRFLKAVVEGAGRMEVLIQDLLAYTRATRHTEGPVPAADPRRVLERVLADLGPLIEQSGAQVTAGALPPFPMHEVHLTQLLQNLIGNALKYRSAEDPHVRVSASERDGRVTISVADNGIGIDPRFKEQIFGLFKRLHTREEYPGSGIGLAICKRIVEQYGGRIWLESSAPGGGSVFSFEVPVAPRR